MSNSLVRVSLKERKLYGVKMQRESATTPGTALKKGLEYLGVSDRDVFGPYEEGCDDGRLCFDVPMQKQKGGTIINVKMSGQQQIQAWYAADSLADLFGDGSEIYYWPDLHGEHDLSPVQWQGDNDSGLFLQANTLNGHAVVNKIQKWPSYSQEHLLSELTDTAGLGAFTVYTVARFPGLSGTTLGAYIADSNNMTSSGVGMQRGLFLTGVDGALYFAPMISITGYDEGNGFVYLPVLSDTFQNYPLASTDWRVYAVRYAPQRAIRAGRVNGELITIPWADDDLRGAKADEFPSSVYVGLGFTVGGSVDEGGLIWSLAESRIYPGAHTDAQMVENTNALRAKYNI